MSETFAVPARGRNHPIPGTGLGAGILVLLAVGTTYGLSRWEGLLVINGRDLFTEVRAAKVGITAAETAKIRKDVLDVQRSSRGTCVRTDLPLDLG